MKQLMQSKHRRLARLGASLCLVAGMLGLGAAHAADAAKPAAMVTSIAALPANLRPQGVPADFVVTPNGYFAANCVQVVHADEKLQADGRIERMDGALRAPAACTQPHYTLSGMRVAPDGSSTALAGRTQPTINGWVLDTNFVSNTSVGRIVADWTVPSAPSNAGSQVIYFFPGLEQLPTVQSILQPVLGWNGYGDGAWTLASWNCCVNGTTYHSDPINVSSGDKVVGDTYSTCAAGVSCSTWAIVSKDTTTNQSTTLNTNPYSSLTWVFGGVLEAYGVDTCNQYPHSGSISFTNIAVYNLNKVQIASPSWSHDMPVGSQSPQCNYGITATSSTTNLVY